MKAIICSAYGGPEVLVEKNIPTPVPKDNEVLIKVQATAVNTGDVRIRKADPWLIKLVFGWKHPRQPILGGTYAGEIVAVGKQVTQFSIGEQVYGTAGLRFGAYAEFLALPQTAAIVKRPNTITPAQAATIPFGAMAALYFINRTGVQSGQHVLVLGAAGLVGSAAVQLAKQRGAIVTGVCASDDVSRVTTLGATKTFVYTRDDMWNDPQRYDVVIDTVGVLPRAKLLTLVKQKGTLAIINAGPMDMVMSLFRHQGKRIVTGTENSGITELKKLNELVMSGMFVPDLDRTFIFSDMVAAHEYFGSPQRHGAVAVTLEP